MTNQQYITTGFRKFRRGLRDMAIGIAFITANIAKETAQAINSSVHRHPWCYIAAELIIFTALYLYGVGKARQERDHYQHTAYTYQQRANQLQIINESYKQ